MSTSAVFDEIYQSNKWNGDSSRSGPGSGWQATGQTARSISTLVTLLDAETVLDLGCGDGLWMPHLPGYLGMDASGVAIARARVNHPDRRYEVLRDPLPTADLVIVRDVIQHLSLDDGAALIKAVRMSGAMWLLVSTYLDGKNVDIQSGLDQRGRYTFFRPDMSAYLGTPVLLIMDGWDYDTGVTVRDAGKFLGLWAMP